MKPVVTVDAPPDLAALIDAYLAAMATLDFQGRLEAHYALLRWPGWRKRTRYVHGGVAASMIWGSLKVVKWPSNRPEPVLLHDRSMSRDDRA